MLALLADVRYGGGIFASAPNRYFLDSFTLGQATTRYV